MANIERFGVIDQALLSGEFYFQSLMRQASIQGMITDADEQRAQLGCIELLARQIQSYNGGFSSSIRVEQAQCIMDSSLYTIGLWLKSLPSTDAAVAAVKEMAVGELYAQGRRLLGKKIKSARLLYLMVLKNKLKTDNYTYNATVAEGIEGFFKLYNADYCAKDIRITADYPLSIPVTGLVGIEFIEKYLTALYYENDFCLRFSADAIHFLLCGYEQNYRDLIFNIFDQVLAAAIGCKLLSESAYSLDITERMRGQLARLCIGKAEDEILLSLQSVTSALCEDIGLKSASSIRYVERCLPELAARISTAIRIGALEGVFPSPKHPQNKPKLIFSFGKKMEDEAYRTLVKELASCRFLEDKLKLIKRDIHSLADLEEAVLDAELTQTEIMAVFRELGLVEIAALFHRHLKRTGFENLEENDSAQLFRGALRAFIEQLPQKEQELIHKAADTMED